MSVKTLPFFDEKACRRRKRCDWRCLHEMATTLCVGCERHVSSSPKPALGGSRISIDIDGAQRTCAKGDRLIEVLRTNDVDVPSLCYHPLLAGGKCNVCVVEIKTGEDDWMISTSCDVYVTTPISLRTSSHRLDNERTRHITRLLELSPTSAPLRKLAEKMAIPLPPASDNQCLLCERCIQVCRNLHNEPLLRQERGRIIREESHICQACGACLEVCPTDAVPKLSSTCSTHTSCRLCELICPELAITTHPETDIFNVDSTRCKSCGLCENICPENAIRMVALDKD